MTTRQEDGIIGGRFGLEIEVESGQDPPFLHGDDVLVANGRCAIHVLLRHLAPSRVWVPSYLCGSILDAVGSRAVEFYDVGGELTAVPSRWTDEIGPGELVVVIDYFGFLADPTVGRKAKRQGAWVLADACQALLTQGRGRHADFAIYSPRKFLGVPDGGILSIRGKAAKQEAARWNELTAPPEEWWFTAFSSALLRREFDLRGGSRKWFELFQKSEAEAPVGPYAMSSVTRSLLSRAFDYDRIAAARRSNYSALLRRLERVAVFRELPPGAVPVGFPIRVSHRDSLRQALFESGIYPPVHWPIAGRVPKRFAASHRLSAEIMTLPCDQRYTARDMERVADAVEKGMPT